MRNDVAMVLRYLAIVAVAAAEDARRLKFTFGDVSYSSNGVSNSPFGQVNTVMNEAESKMVQPGQMPQDSGDPFESLSDDPFGGDPFSGFGATPKQQEAKGFALTPQNGATVLQGMIHSFLAHKQLQQGELQCLEQGTSAMGSQAAAVAQNIVMIGEEFLSVSNVGKKPSTPGMSAQAPSRGPVKSEADKKLDEANSMFEEMFNGAMGASSGSASSQGAKPAPNPFNAFKGFVNQGSNGPVPVAAPAPAPAQVTDAMNMWGLSQGRRLQMPMMGGMPGMGGAESGGGGGMDPMQMMGGAAMAAQLAKQVQELGGLSHKVMQRCLKGDAQQALKVAASRAQNPAWMQKAFIANGPQALGHMADAINAYHVGDAHTFGDATGIVMREMLLNNADSIPTQALPDKKALANVTGGFMKGFFGPGMTATIKTPEEPNGIQIDLNKCVGKNVGLFQSMWASVMQFYGKQGMPTSQEEKQKQATLLAYAAMQMPRALKMCQDCTSGSYIVSDLVDAEDSREEVNVAPNLTLDRLRQQFDASSPEAGAGGRVGTQRRQWAGDDKRRRGGEEDIQAIKDAIAGMGKGVDMSVHIPQPREAFSKTEAMTDMAQTVSGYQKLISDPSSGIDFGQKLGNIFQKVVENGFSQKYYVDSNGNLRKRLVQLSSQRGLAGAQSLTPALLVLVVVFLLLVLVAVKSRRAFAGWKEHLCQMECTESGVSQKMIPHDVDMEAHEMHEIKPILDEA
ncbi:unnamed protein product [Symbiodinium pilosum]|uniref:Uncharacterized protein n=1 Tax=Symbiodinium pilosum TaxID=2952 RepID=A0A812WBI1_SYMPI|nr:unnamed protein product [Symbiodinium pilosum]